MKRASILAARGHILTAEMRARPRHRIGRVRNPSTDGLSKHLEHLLSALTMDERHRAEEIAHRAPYLLVDGLRQSHYDAIADELENDNDVEAAIWAVHNEDPSWLKLWAKDAAADLMRTDPYEAPSFLFFDRPTVARNAWLVHFSDHAEAIELRGFTKGVDEPSRLGLTTRVSDDYKSRPGYVFSFRPDDVSRYAFVRCRPKYGRSAVVFRADALVAWHRADEEQQAISWGPEAENIIAVRLDGKAPQSCREEYEFGGYRPCIQTADGETCFDDFPALVAWLDARLAAKQRNPAMRRR